jgi:DNA-binding transcriptional LysR family regulator
MPLDPRHLEAFLAVARHGSLGRAAPELNVTQPALSRIIKRLESQLRATLFRRVPGGMELTTFGESLLPHAKLLRMQGLQALEEINALRGSSRGTVRVGAVASAIAALLPNVVQRLLAHSPGLRIQILEGVEDRLTSALNANEIEIAIAGAMPESETIVRIAEHAFRDTTVVIAAPRHPLQRKAQVRAADLANERWVMPPRDTEPRRRFDAMLAEAGVASANVAIETRSVSAVKALIAGSSLLSWLPRPLFVAEERAQTIRALAVEGMTMHRQFFVYGRRHGLMSPPAAKLLEQLGTAPQRAV